MFIFKYLFIGLFLVDLAKTEDKKRRSLEMKFDGSCKPNSYVKVECNLCQCDANGRVEWNHCTKRECKGYTDKTQGYRMRAKRIAPDRRMNVHGSCEAKTWYSLAPCQFCYCVNDNKLVCSTGTQKSQILELGMYNMSVCGQNLVKEIMELIPERQDALREGSQQNKKDPKNTESKQNSNFKPLNQGNYKEPVDMNIPYKINREKETRNENNDKEDDSESGISIESTLKQDMAHPKLETTAIPEDLNIEYDKRDESEETKSAKHKRKHNKDKSATVEPLISMQEINDGENNESPAGNVNPQGVLRLKLPMVLNKILQMSMRRETGDDDELPSAGNTKVY